MEKILASYSKDRTIRLWQIPDGNLLSTLSNHNEISKIIFSPDGQIIASHVYLGTIRLWSSLDLHQLVNQPIEQMIEKDREFIHKSLKKKISKEERHWLEFMQELINWHRRFDVEVGDAPQLVGSGEFDIEIEG